MSTTVPGIAGTGSLHAMSGASAGMPPQQKMTSLYNNIDTSGSGSITQQQFDQAFQTLNPPPVFQMHGADAIFAALDPNGTGSVSKQDFVSGMSGLMVSLRSAGAPSETVGQAPDQTLASSLQSLNALDPSSVPSKAQPGSYFSTTA
jgi:hypothetical protein